MEDSKKKIPANNFVCLYLTDYTIKHSRYTIINTYTFHLDIIALRLLKLNHTF